MAKEKTLDTPFEKGEKVVTTRDLRGIPTGSQGKIQLSNGLGAWNRYWIRFEDGQVMGQVSHVDLVRPDQVTLWHEKQEADRLAAERADDEPEEPETATPAKAASSGGDDLASRIPEHLLERSREAKTRLLG